MDKYEYKVRADEIKELIAQGEYIQAAEIADAIDWRRVKSVMMLCTVSDLYKINRRYEDAKNLLLLAYERRPGGRTICYALCELCIKMEEFIQAVEYYKEFVQVAPKDPGRYILQYKLYEAQDVSLEERIGVLEELKKRDYREKWAYELAYLYHRVGLAAKCVEECDELILWFGDGKYVVKAMELKMLHQPLTAAQQKKYDHRFDVYKEPVQEAEMPMEEAVYDGAQIYVDMQDGVSGSRVQESGLAQGDTKVYEAIRRSEQPPADVPTEPSQPEDLDIQVKIMDMGQYNTLNLREALEAELEAGMKEILGDEISKSDAITRSIVAPMMETESLDYPELADEDVSEEDVDNGVEQIESTEVFFGETGEIGTHQPESVVVPELSEVPDAAVSELSESSQIKDAEIPEVLDVLEDSGAVEMTVPERQEEVAEVIVPEAVQEDVPADSRSDTTAEIVMNQLRMESIGRAVEQAMIAQPPKELAGVLSQESDGQISLVVPEREVVEKQITGQMSIADILFEWEQMKKETEERRKEEVRQRVLQQTGPLFTEFEESARDGLLEQLESGQVEGDPVSDVESELPQEAENFGDESGVEEMAESDDADNAGQPEEEEYSDEPGSEEDLGEVEELEEILEDVDEQEDTGEQEDVDEQEDTGDQDETYASETEAQQDGFADEEFGTESAGNEISGDEALEEFREEDSAEEKDDIGGADAPERTDTTETTEENGAEVPAAPDQSEKGMSESGEKTGEEQVQNEEPEQDSVEREQAKVRALTREEKELFASYIQSKASREQLTRALDNISMASYTGNVIITGGEGMDTSTLAKNIIRDVQMTDSNFAGKVAKISGQAMNKKDVAATLQQLKSGALIIQKASGMNSQTADALHKALQGESLGIIVVMEDTKKAMSKLLEENKALADSFTARMDVEALSNDMLVSFGRQYAKEREYSIDDMGVLELHTRIEELQTIDHAVTVMEVKGIVDEAIRHANRKTLGHFIDVLLAKRYDEEDMIILTEKDFS